MTSFRDYETDKEWAYNRPPAALKPYFKLEEYSPSVYEVVILDGWRGKVVSNRPDRSYATSDLFVKHPTLEAYKFVGRVDDTLVLVRPPLPALSTSSVLELTSLHILLYLPLPSSPSTSRPPSSPRNLPLPPVALLLASPDLGFDVQVTGEKVNPVPIELTLRGESPYVKDAIVFGVERTQTGALVILSDIVDPATPRDELVKLIAPAVELANSEAPTHSRLTEEMLVFLPADTVVPRADKGSFIRRKVYVSFKDIIDKGASSLSLTLTLARRPLEPTDPDPSRPQPTRISKAAAAALDQSAR